MTRIKDALSDLRLRGRKALIPYVTCGYPSLAFTEQLVLGLARSGADLIELGIPYSDPVADGPTIQLASQAALENGVNLERIFNLTKALAAATHVPLILMTYFNPIYRWGCEAFVSSAAEAGAAGLIVPDVPVEEAGNLRELCLRYGLDLIFLVAPTSTDERIEKIAKQAAGFIYCVSVTGITGSRKDIGPGLEDFMQRVRNKTQLPLAVGFGISSPETAVRVAQVSDGIIVGSSLIEKITENLSSKNFNYPEIIEEVCSYFRTLRAALD